MTSTTTTTTTTTTMADDDTDGKNSSPEKEEKKEEEEEQEKEEKKTIDPELFSCLLQPPNADSNDDNYVGFRRLLLYRKAESGVVDRRMDWKCNGRGYVAYRNYISRPRNWESLHIPSGPSTPGQREKDHDLHGLEMILQLEKYPSLILFRDGLNLAVPAMFKHFQGHSLSGGRWVPSPSPLSILCEVDSWGSSRDLRGFNLGHSQSFSSTFSDSDRPLRKVEPAYSFVGMHCIFDHCKASVTVLKFGHMSSDLLAYGASDGTLTVCSVSQPPSIIKHLSGHSKDVTDFDFTSNNQYIASSSLDKTVRIWEISKGNCIRVIYGVSSQLCIRFHPGNNNFLSVGNGNREITVINFSTGRIINKAAFENEITALDHDHTGQLLFCGDAQGCLYTVSMNSHTGALSRSHRNRSGFKRKSPITTVQYRTFSLLARGPVLLACTQDGSLCFFSVALEIQGYLTLRCSLKLAPRVHSIRASFCPLLSLEKGEFIVAGSEDSNVYFYDLTRPKHTCVNKLQGHSSTVIGVAWNNGENLLASSDSDGTVIVWKRAKTS